MYYLFWIWAGLSHIFHNLGTGFYHQALAAELNDSKHTAFCEKKIEVFLESTKRYSTFLLLVFFSTFPDFSLISFFYSPYPFSSCFETFSRELTFRDWWRTGQRWEWRHPVIGQGREFLLTHPWCHRQRRGRWRGCSPGVPTESVSTFQTESMSISYYKILHNKHVVHTENELCFSPLCINILYIEYHVQY